MAELPAALAHAHHQRQDVAIRHAHGGHGARRTRQVVLEQAKVAVFGRTERGRPLARRGDERVLLASEVELDVVLVVDRVVGRERARLTIDNRVVVAARLERSRHPLECAVAMLVDDALAHEFVRVNVGDHVVVVRRQVGHVHPVAVGALIEVKTPARSCKRIN